MFNSQGHIATGSLWVEEPVHTSWSRFCTVNQRASANIYQLSNMKHPGRDLNRWPQRLKVSTRSTTPRSPPYGTNNKLWQTHTQAAIYKFPTRWGRHLPGEALSLCDVVTWSLRLMLLEVGRLICRRAFCCWELSLRPRLANPDMKELAFSAIFVPPEEQGDDNWFSTPTVKILL